MKDPKDILKEIRRKAEKKKRLDAEKFVFKPNNKIGFSLRLRPDQIEFMEILQDAGYQKSKLIRNALDREFRRKKYRSELKKFKNEK